LTFEVQIFSDPFIDNGLPVGRIDGQLNPPPIPAVRNGVSKASIATIESSLSAMLAIDFGERGVHAIGREPKCLVFARLDR